MNGFSPELLVSSSLPRAVAEDNPLLVKFFEYYYEFAENARIQDIIQQIRRFVDIDQTDQEFLEKFFEEFKQIPRNIVVDERLLAKHIMDLYKSKGSEKSLLLLFKILYGEDITVRYPGETVLKASVGRWVKDTVLNITTLTGEIKATTNYIELSNAYGTQQFPIELIELVTGTNKALFTIHLPSTFIISNFELMSFYSNGTLDGTGKIDDIVGTITVTDGGSGWKVGQIMMISGALGNQGTTVLNGSAQVAIFSNPLLNGELAYVYNGEYEHQVAMFAGTYKDTIAQVKEVSSTGAVKRVSIVQYGFGNSVTTYTLMPQISTGNETPATIQIGFGKQVAGLGYFETPDGMLSVPEICLEDNFFYQLFSYVIETNHLLSEFESSLKLIHPAGTKYFVNTRRVTTIEETYTITRDLVL